MHDTIRTISVVIAALALVAVAAVGYFGLQDYRDEGHPHPGDEEDIPVATASEVPEASEASEVPWICAQLVNARRTPFDHHHLLNDGLPPTDRDFGPIPPLRTWAEEQAAGTNTSYLEWLSRSGDRNPWLDYHQQCVPLGYPPVRIETLVEYCELGDDPLTAEPSLLVAERCGPPTP